MPEEFEAVDSEPTRPFTDRLRAATRGKDATEVVAALLDAAIEAGLCDAAGIIGALPRQDLMSVLATDDLASAADRRQCELESGPALDALRTRTTVASGDLRADLTWPDWADTTGPIGAALSVPLNPDRGLGALTFYSRLPRTFSVQDREDAEAVADRVCLTLRHRVAVDNLIRAMESRTVIGQAQGVLMERYRMSPAEAFATLTRYSQQHNVKLAVLAEQLASSGQLDGIAADVMRDLPRPRPRGDH